MMPVLVPAAVLLPLLFPALALVPDSGRIMRYGLPLLPLPALTVALLSGPGWTLELPYLLNGGVWLLDELRRVFLLLTACLWTTAGLYAAGYLHGEHLRRFCAFWGLTLAGNLGLIMAGDIASFYSFFALMTFAAYGLVVHEGSPQALRAGRIYLVMAVLGEMALLAGLIFSASEAQSGMLQDLPPAIAEAEHRDLILGLLITGFGVKAGLPLLHFWLPLAHPVAPTPASAVLSGAMIKAGLLGWLLTLPLAETALPQWGTVMIMAGALASIGAALIGVCQQQAKAVLAYSSISQMGLITIMLGVALADPERAPVIIPVIGLYALHHGLAKGSLFLSAGLSIPAHKQERWLMWALITLPGLALAGLPFTSGAVAKLAMKEALAPEALELGPRALLAPLISAGAIATLLLVLRYLWVLHKHTRTAPNHRAVLMGWLATVLISLLGFWLMPWNLANAPGFLPSPYELWKLGWPMLTALVLAWMVSRSAPGTPSVPAGDGIVLIERLASSIGTGVLRAPTRPRMTRGQKPSYMNLFGRLREILEAKERQFRQGMGLTMLLLVLLLSLL
ncbi:formate hydrogenlyase subunit 3/multisubunit Na+/H+ antiporter MnhD subunit [Halospina denitrificans]|uniref:Formate hydrogenlyase subunit 3/multisubunit Na+/H+ antiporter MnhD subunit n=1 Tax=Halospina denitrificans TaxID=332522 RepID=A0A4R7JZG6_9GAMM|nr:complex I subunit 5 family protein [Halospina denitrificans]TDT43364.1 formate hydrogenlyase subunit 3/multisubunit Na+/H+ antiporter MnhD subunit [Halospina denitrificans]